MTQRAKVGYFPRCSRPTHIAAPSRYVVGEFSPRKARGVSLSMEHGPWAARFFTAPLYAQEWGCFPPTWDSAAQSLNATAPPLFEAAFGAVHAPSPTVSLPSTQEKTEVTPELEVTLTAGVTDPDEDLFNYRRRSPMSNSPSNYADNPSRT